MIRLCLLLLRNIPRLPLPRLLLILRGLLLGRIRLAILFTCPSFLSL